MRVARQIGNTLAILMTWLWLYASQAHFTDRFSPALAQDLDNGAQTLQSVNDIFGALSIEQVRVRMSSDIHDL